jgi:uncharacterized protein
MATRERPFDPTVLSVPSLCQEASLVSGDWPLAGFTRLADSLFAAPEGSVAWLAQGEQVPVAGADPELWIRLQATAPVVLQCQRCLKATPHQLQVDRRIRFAYSEAEAEKLDENSEDDVLALTPRLNLHELVEDELILALPIVARHEGPCPEPLPLPADVLEDEPAAPNPFAALAALRKPS